MLRDWKIIISSLILGTSIIVSSVFINHSVLKMADVLKNAIHVDVDHNFLSGKKEQK